MKKILYSLFSLTLLLASCNTIEDRDSMGPVLTPDQLKIAVIQNPAGSNTVVLQNNTPDVVMYFDYGSGATHRAIDTIYFPFASTVKLKYTAFCAGGTVTDSTTITIAQNDDSFFDKDKAWKGLTGGGTGQTWMFATDPTNPSKKIAGNGPEECEAPEWWAMTAAKLTAQVSSPYGMADEVYMDLKGAANFVVKHSDGSQTKGFFNVIAPYVKEGVSFSAIEVLGGPTFPWPTLGKYHFTKMTPDELSVHEFGNGGVEETCYLALYKRKGAY